MMAHTRVFKMAVAILLVIFQVQATPFGRRFLQRGELVTSASSSPTNGSTLQDIMHELHMDTSARIMGGCSRSVGTFGGGGGGSFNDFPEDCNGVIKRIEVYAGANVDGLDITYRLPNGQFYSPGLRGTNGGGKNVIDVDIDNGERIIGVFGKSGSLVDQIGFITNQGKIFGPYGSCGGGNFHVNSCHLRGIYGRAGRFIDSIGFFCSNV